MKKWHLIIVIAKRDVKKMILTGHQHYKKKRTCNKPEAAAAALTPSDGATTTCDHWSEQAVAKLEKEKR